MRVGEGFIKVKVMKLLIDLSHPCEEAISDALTYYWENIGDPIIIAFQ